MPRRFASTPSTGTERALEKNKERRTEQQAANSTPLAGPRDYQSRQTFPAAPWACDNQKSELWDDAVNPPGAVDSAAYSVHDFGNNEHDNIGGMWTITHAYSGGQNQYGYFAWAVPFQKFADNMRVGVRIYITSDCATAVTPSDVFDSIYLAYNQKGSAETKRDIKADIAAFGTWYYIYDAHAGNDISALAGNLYAWIEVKTKTFYEETAPIETIVYIEYLTVEQWNRYNTIV